MEWVETTGRTVEAALDLALDTLGVDEDEVEFEVLEEPRGGLLGRRQARIRARVRPISRRSPGSGSAEPADPEAAATAGEVTRAAAVGEVTARRRAGRREPQPAGGGDGGHRRLGRRPRRSTAPTGREPSRRDGEGGRV